MNGKWTRVLVLVVSLMLALTPFGIAEEADENMGALGIGLSSFWPFVELEYGENICPYGMDAFLFDIVAPAVQPGEGMLEIRKVEDDSVVATIDVKDIEYSYVVGDIMGDGNDIPYTSLLARLDDPLVVFGKIYLFIPDGAFVSEGKPSKAFGDPDNLMAIIADCGFDVAPYERELAVGQTTQLSVLVGSAAVAAVVASGAVTTDVTELKENGRITVTAAEIGEGQVQIDFFDAEGNLITSGYDMFTCK